MIRTRLFALLFPVLAIVVSACGAATPSAEPTAVPTDMLPSAPTATAPTVDPAPSLEPAAAGGSLRLVMAAEGNQAQFAVTEQLASLALPSDAVGTTTAISGALVILPDGQLVASESRFVVDLTTLKTDSSRRDGYIQRNTLETATYPEAVFVSVSAGGLPSPLPTAGPVAFQLSGDLTIHGVTHPVTWEVTGEVVGRMLTGTATTSITFTDFGMTLPRVGPVLSVEDQIRLQLDFTLNAE